MSDSTPAENATKKIRKISQMEFVRLSEYMEKNKGRLQGRPYTDLVIELSAILNLPLSEKTVSSLAKHHKFVPPPGAKERGKSPAERLGRLETVLAEVILELGLQEKLPSSKKLLEELTSN